MTIRTIQTIRNNHQIGEKITVRQPGTDRVVPIDVEIIGKYPYFALVSSGLIRWCVLWQDFSF